MKTIVFPGILVAALAAGACNDGNAASAGPDAAAPDVDHTFDRDTVTLFGKTGTVDQAGAIAREAGVTVCVDAHPAIPCTESDPNGNYRVPTLPPDSDVTVTFRRDDLYDGAFEMHTPHTGNSWVDGRMFTPERAAEIMTLGGYTSPSPNTGLVVVVMFDGFERRVSGATVVPTTGDPAVYLGPLAQPQPALEGTTIGVAVLYDRQPGDVEFRLDTPGYRCDLGGELARTTSEPGLYRATAFAQTVTFAMFQCGPDLR